jgi:signal peptidase I
MSEAVATPKRSFVSSVTPTVNLLAWVYIYLVGLLIIWVAIVAVSTGWRPVVITSGSMAPTLRPGDVIMVEDHPEELLGQRTIITFDSPRGDGELITHRLFEVLVNDSAYITKGDANPSPDTDRVSPEQVSGVGRLVVPLVGLPIVWIEQGKAAPLGAMAILSVAALAIAFRNSQRSRGVKLDNTKRTSDLADRAVRRVRYLVALMIASQFFLDGGRFEAQALGLSRTQLLVVAISGLLAVNAMSSRAVNTTDQKVAGRYALAELAADTVLVILLTTATGGTGIGWVLIALPIVEAAVRFRLAGALLHWMAMAGVLLATRLWVLERSSAPITEVITGLEDLLDQLGVLLLVAIPGAYLAEQLVSDVATQRDATDSALERGRLLEHVAEIGHEVNRLGSELFDTLTESALQLGFDVSDICVRLPFGEWRILSQQGDAPLGDLPAPGEAGSGLRDEDLADSEVVVDRGDPDLSEFVPLAGIGIRMLARITLSTSDDTHISMRAGKRVGTEDASGSIEALRLLCGQATVALQNKQLVTDLRDLHEELEHQANHDVLTGLPNRAMFVNELARALAGSTDPQRRHVVMFLDLDGFKGVNDTMGHEAGDVLLQQVGARLVDTVGSAGLVARLGGDEFTALLKPLASPKEALQVASSVHASLLEPFMIDNEKVQISASVGLAHPEAGVTESELLRRADAAMYSAKQSGGSTRIAVYQPIMDEGERRRGRLAAEFKKALERDELNLVYQPIVSADTEEVVGAEALLRWTHGEIGVVNTATILELAEVSARVDELNAWILRTALSSLKALNISDEAEFRMAVNVSPAELISPQLIPNVGDALLLSGISPDRLVIELSERIVASAQHPTRNLAALAELGARISLDDFGEGHTSLAHLRGLPIQELKLDRVLVQQACTGETDRIILESVVELSHGLGLEVVAEGVETTEHQDAATTAGADRLQGYGLYRPMSLDHLQTLLQRSGKIQTVLVADAEPVTADTSDGGDR